MKQTEWLTPQEVGNLIGGFSAQFVRNEIRAGELAALYVRSRNGKMGYYRVRLVDAEAYQAHLITRSLAPTKPASVTGPALNDVSVPGLDIGGVWTSDKALVECVVCHRGPGILVWLADLDSPHCVPRHIYCTQTTQTTKPTR